MAGFIKITKEEAAAAQEIEKRINCPGYIKPRIRQIFLAYALEEFVPLEDYIQWAKIKSKYLN